nr:MAG TPA: Single stranded DNA binding protein [Bacteriophage sp.]
MNDPRITLPLARLAADPELKQTSNGTPYMLIRVASTGGHMDRSTKQWVNHDVMWATIFEYDLRLTETYERMLRKGTPVRVEGTLKWKTGTDNQGQPRTDFIIEHATISLAMLKAKKQQPQQTQQSGNQWTGTNTFGPTSSFNQTSDEWGVY